MDYQLWVYKIRIFIYLKVTNGRLIWTLIFDLRNQGLFQTIEKLQVLQKNGFIGKVKKFGIGWCIPHRMVADNAKGGLARPPPPPRI